MSGHVSPEQLTKYILYCEWLIYATWRLTDNLSSLLQSVGASEKVFQLIDLLPSDQFLSKGKHSVSSGTVNILLINELNHAVETKVHNYTLVTIITIV